MSIPVTALLENWQGSRVTQGREPTSRMVDDFLTVLGDATDERPLQRFLASFPSLLGPLAPPGGGYWCLDRPRFGSEYIPDFLLASATSAGFSWAMIELEDPNASPLTRAGIPSRKLAQALAQIRDWHMWITENIAYARNEIGLTDIAPSCAAFVIIGRRSGLNSSQLRQYTSLSTERLTVMSYDRLYDHMRRNACESEAWFG